MRVGECMFPFRSNFRATIRLRNRCICLLALNGINNPNIVCMIIITVWNLKATNLLNW